MSTYVNSRNENDYDGADSSDLEDEKDDEQASDEGEKVGGVCTTKTYL